MKIKLTVLMSFLSLTIFAQNIKGIVLDHETDKVIASAHVYFDDNDDDAGAITNEKGKFELNTETNRDKFIRISHLGYMTQKVTISKISEEGLKIYLVKDHTELNKVVVKGDKKLQLTIPYTEKASLKRGLHEFAAAITDDKIIVIGGKNNHTNNAFANATEITSRQIAPTFDELMNRMSLMVTSYGESHSGKLMMYDIEKDTWETSDLEFRERASHNLHVYDDEIYVMGGKRVSGNNIYLDDVVEIYDTKSNVIKEDTPNPHQAVNFASVSYGDYLIFLGGVKKINKRGKKKYTRDIHFYNVKSGYWYKLGEMPEAKETKAVVVNDAIYLIGGFNRKPLNRIESFDLKTGKWKIEGELFRGMERPALATKGNVIYIYNKGRISTYNTVSKELNEYAISLNVEAGELFYHNNHLYILGGYVQNGAYMNPSRKVYRIDIEAFSNTKVRNTKNVQEKTES
ncbi:MAG: kelch repeat-containing protein [Bacteroidota bacterium]